MTKSFQNSFAKRKKPLRRNKTNTDSNKIPRGVVHIQTTLNNTIITVTNAKGQVLGWSSAGCCGFKGARKSTPFAAKLTGETAARHCLDNGIQYAKVMVKGPGPGRDSALRGLLEAGLGIAMVQDVTGLPHNGCRPPKKRRV